MDALLESDSWKYLSSFTITNA